MTEILPLNAITDLARASYPVCSRDRARQGCRARASMDGFTACRGSRQGSLRRNQGFTLIEMVAVMVLLSFGLIAGTQLFTMTAQSYRDTSVRMKQTQDGRFVIERISRELREALPSSVRTAALNGCPSSPRRVICRHQRPSIFLLWKSIPISLPAPPTTR